MPRTRQNLGNIEISEEIIGKFVIHSLKNASVNKKMKSSLKATHSRFTAEYLELVMLELISFFTGHSYHSDGLKLFLHSCIILIIIRKTP